MNEREQIVGLVSAYDEFSEWRGGKVWCVSDLKLDSNVLDLQTEDGLRSNIAQINLLLLDQVHEMNIAVLTWQVFENDGGHLEGSEAIDGEYETGIVKDQLVKSGFKVICDDIMVKEF